MIENLNVTEGRGMETLSFMLKLRQQSIPNHADDFLLL